MKNINLFTAIAVFALLGCATKKKEVTTPITEPVKEQIVKRPWRPAYFNVLKKEDTSLIKAISFYPSTKITIRGAFGKGEVYVEDGKLYRNDDVLDITRKIDTVTSGRLASKKLRGSTEPVVISFSVSDKSYRLEFSPTIITHEDLNHRRTNDTVFVLNRSAQLFYNGSQQWVTATTENNQRCILLFYDILSSNHSPDEGEAEGIPGGNARSKKKQ